MNILFTQRYKYTINEDIDNVRDDIESIINKRCYDFSVNMKGRFKSDGSFLLTHKLSLAIIRCVETSPAYLTGTLSFKDNKTTIDTSVRPNSLFVGLFYLMIILFVCELFGNSMFIGESKTFSLIFFPLFSILLFGLIKLFTIGIRKKFERLLHLRREE